MKREIPKPTLDAINEYSLRLRNALRTFRASDDPLWKRTKEGLDWFNGLRTDNLPPHLIADIDRRFGAITAILARHAVNSFEEYQRVPAHDLAAIQDLIEGFAFDP